MNIGLDNNEKFLPLHRWESGGLALCYEAGNLRYIKFNGGEGIRMIYPAIRDENWKTVPFTIHDKKIEEDETQIGIRYRAVFDSAAVKYEAEFELKADREGMVSFEMKGRALTGFKSKRVGICVLLPVHSCKGRQVEVRKADGTSEEAYFPELVSAATPFTDVKGLKWTAAGGASVDVIFEGDLFETEDQRNWMDNSYKTYSGPQHRVKMLDIAAGGEMRQKVIIHLRQAGPAAATVPEGMLQSNTKLPEIGSGFLASTTVPWDHFTLQMKWNEWDKIAELSASAVPLRLNILFDDFSDDELQLVSNELQRRDGLVKSILVLSAHESVVQPQLFIKTYHFLKKDHPGVNIGYGSSSWFADLNEVLPLEFTCDFAGFTVCPQSHMTDHRTILENTEAQRSIMDTMRKAMPGLPVNITVKFSMVADSRWPGGFGAWWMLHTLAGLHDAASLTFYDAGKEGSPLAETFEKVIRFRPVRVSVIKNAAGADPAQAVMAAAVSFENAGGERLTFTMKDI